MIGTSLLELVFIRVCIILVQHSISLCVLLIALLRVTGGPPTLTTAFTSLLALELFYAVLIYLPFKARLRASARHPPPLTPKERAKLFERCLASVPDPERYLQLWFLGADPGEIKRENVKDFILWAFFDRKSVERVHSHEHHSVLDSDGGWVSYDSFGREEEPLLNASAKTPGDGAEEDVDALEHELDSYLSRTEKMLGRPLPPGRGTAVPLRLTFDVVETRYRSVVWYAIVSLVDFATHCTLFWHGFQLRAPSWRRALSVFPLRPELLLPSLPGRMQGWKGSSPSSELSYWYRQHTSKTSLPVVFIHGIGIGLHPYTTFLAEIPQDTGVIALEILPISMRLCSAPLSRPDFLRQLELIVSHHGWDSFVLVSHSYGSVLTTHILRSPTLAPKVAGAVLVDPVSICLHLPDVAYNFTRRPPRRANEWQLWYFASMDPGTALALGRHFFWRENLIWKEELVSLPSDNETVLENGVPGTSAIDEKGGVAVAGEIGSQGKKRKVAVVLSGRDLIVDTLSVARYLLCDGDLGSSPQYDENVLLEKLAGGTAAAHAPPGGDKRGGRCLTKDGIEILWFPTLDHSQVFDTAKDRSQVLDVISRYCSF
ncbi:Alpha beta hydrolase fold family [Pleurostoma richardsiae]|uniref:Alpha beta hydrolase fold family n=1 Tax=Pleurostoma richardsiae TaxID=41990 RepID=A0AA38RL85_9PEZI|nr:Alpha beta hydrolase fold family [Pleurostoma richardsiae]